MPTRKTTVSKPKSRSSSAAGRSAKPVQLPDGMRERISRKAYELWEQRGRQECSALRNWLDAEEIIMKEIHEARE